MPRVPQYGYSAQHAASQVPSHYYYEDIDGYAGDYANNEPVPDEQIPLGNANVADIYKKRTTPRHLHEQMRSNVYCTQPSYYYEHLPAPIPRSHPSYQRHIPLLEERTRYYTHQVPVPLEECYGDSMLYAATPPTNTRRVSTSHQVLRPSSTATAQAVASSNAVVRRRPVSVRTPRYYRRVPVSNLCKKPSTLCLPLSSQPDPAVYRRIKKVPEVEYHNQNCVCTGPNIRYVKPTSMPGLHHEGSIPQDSLKRPHLSISDVDAVLNQYDTIFNEYSEAVEDFPISSTEILDQSTKKLPINLKPKVPLSLKYKEEPAAKDQSTTNIKEDDLKLRRAEDTTKPLEVEQITTDVLDTMLSELVQSGCENSIEENFRQPLCTKIFSQLSTSHMENQNNELKNNRSQSFNYQDISKNFSNSQQQIAQKPSTTSQCISPTPLEQNDISLDNPLKPKSLKSFDGHGITELHRSKSYIVSLIDRALSKELGTPQDRHFSGSKSVEYLDAHQAADMINRQREKMDKELCMEITQALSESFTSNTSDRRDTASCLCSSQNAAEEPCYVKQLKQLRWGHIKHIQREVRRLEDLERFLDSCTSHTYM